MLLRKIKDPETFEPYLVPVGDGFYYMQSYWVGSSFEFG